MGCLVVLMLVPTAIGHAERYTNGTGDVLVYCDLPRGSIGGACFDPGHLGDDEVILAIQGFDFHPVSGLYCQDLGGNGVCGEASAGEPASVFCEFVLLTAGEDWDPGSEVFVFVDLVFGNPITNPCHTLYSGSESGVVRHFSAGA